MGSSCSHKTLPIIVQQVRSFILKDMRARYPSDLLLCMGAITHPGHKSLSWLNSADKNRIVQQLKTENDQCFRCEILLRLRKMNQKRQSHQQRSQRVQKRKISIYSLAKRKMKV